MSIVRPYTEEEVAGILKKSEDVAVQGQGAATGHAEGLHELRAVGRNRQSTTVTALLNRATWQHKTTVSAFDGSQVEAVTRALNSGAGQATLTYLNNDVVAFVFATIILNPANLAMKYVRAETSFLEGMRITENFGISTGTVGAVSMKLIRVDRNSIHIRTAFPLLNAAASTCEITYSNGVDQRQTLPA
jgi:hypothetical protein